MRTVYYVKSSINSSTGYSWTDCYWCSLNHNYGWGRQKKGFNDIQEAVKCMEWVLKQDYTLNVQMECEQLEEATVPVELTKEEIETIIDTIKIYSHKCCQPILAKLEKAHG